MNKLYYNYSSIGLYLRYIQENDFLIKHLSLFATFLLLVERVPLGVNFTEARIDCVPSLQSIISARTIAINHSTGYWELERGIVNEVGHCLSAFTSKIGKFMDLHIVTPRICVKIGVIICGSRHALD